MSPGAGADAAGAQADEAQRAAVVGRELQRAAAADLLLGDGAPVRAAAAAAGLRERRCRSPSR